MCVRYVDQHDSGRTREIANETMVRIVRVFYKSFIKCFVFKKIRLYNGGIGIEPVPLCHGVPSMAQFLLVQVQP